MLRLAMGFALGVLAHAHTANMIVTQSHGDLGNSLDRLEDRVHGTIAARRILELGSVLMAQTNRRGRRCAGAGARMKTFKRPQCRSVMDDGLGERLDVGIID